MVLVLLSKRRPGFEDHLLSLVFPRQTSLGSTAVIGFAVVSIQKMVVVLNGKFGLILGLILGLIRFNDVLWGLTTCWWFMMDTNGFVKDGSEWFHAGYQWFHGLQQCLAMISGS